MTTASIPATTRPTHLIRLRCLIAILGERAEWWGTQCFTPTGLQTLTRFIAPRTGLKAAYESVSAVACSQIDERVGERGYHLFRFPPGLEWVLEQESTAVLSAPEYIELASAEEAQLHEHLTELVSDGQPPKGAINGTPVSLGAMPAQLTLRHVKAIAAAYQAGLAASTAPAPYFTRQEAE